MKAEVNSISRSDIESQLAHSFTDRLAIPEISCFYPAQSLANACFGLDVTQTPKPFGIGFKAIFALIADDLVHGVSVA